MNPCIELYLKVINLNCLTYRMEGLPKNWLSTNLVEECLIVEGTVNPEEENFNQDQWVVYSDCK